jgi:hypothetical protein
MNERIKELADQAKQSVPQGILGVDTWIETYNEKFAELLVNECVGVIDGMKFTSEGPSEQAAYQRTLCGVAIKEYFGLQSKGPISSKNIL